VHEAVVSHHDLRPDDIFWCTADPGWVTGTSYGIISPLTNGVAIRIKVLDGTVTLSGVVHDWIEHDAIRNAAWSAPGVRMVEDHLTIS